MNNELKSVITAFRLTPTQKAVWDKMPKRMKAARIEQLINQARKDLKQ